MVDVRDAICRINAISSEFVEIKGTGFFIDSTTILSCNHVFQNLNDEKPIKISVYQKPEKEHTVNIIAQSEEYDYAILKIETDIFESPVSLKLVSSFLFAGLELNLFGYPHNNDSEERMTGVSIEVTINNINLVFISDVKHDIILDLGSSGNQLDHEGISGSPIFNSKNEVVGIFKRQGVFTFGAVSVKRAEQFLIDNNIEVKPDSLNCFSSYADGIFTHFEDLKLQCEGYSEDLIKEVNPQLILKSRGGKLFYPEKKESIDEIIKFLKKITTVDENLWKGWLELLTFVKLLDGESKDLNHLKVPLTRTENYKRLGIFPKKIKSDTLIGIDLYFTEKETYSKIVKKFIHKEFNGDNVATNICHVFNSNENNFGSKPIKTSDIILDITNPKNSGPEICRPYVGILSLKLLRDEVIKSNSEDESKIKLKKLIEDAIIKI
jgi:hypothetical protein